MRERRRSEPVGRLVEQHVDRHALPDRRLLGLDEAQIEQVVDDPREPVGLLHELRRELLDHRVVLAVADRLGEERERADRRLELVAHVGDEVATNALDPARLRDVVDERGRADDVLRGVPDRHGGDVEHPARRAEECQLVLAGLTAERALDEPFDRVLRERVAVARVAEPLGREVPDDLVPVGVDDEHAVGERSRARR